MYAELRVSSGQNVAGSGSQEIFKQLSHATGGVDRLHLDGSVVRITGPCDFTFYHDCSDDGTRKQQTLR